MSFGSSCGWEEPATDMACRLLIHDYGLVNSNQLVKNVTNSFKSDNRVRDDNVLPKAGREIDVFHDIDRTSSLVCETADTTERIVSGIPITIREYVPHEPTHKMADDNTIAPSTGQLDDGELSVPHINRNYVDNYVPPDTLIDNDEFTISDIYRQATLIGQDIEEMNHKHGSPVADKIMPKLILVLDKLEGAVVTHNDNKSKIKALLLEQEDLVVQQRITEEEKEKLTVKLEDAETRVETSGEKLQMKIKLLKMENKLLSKELKKKNKKVKKLRNGERGNSVLWLVDRFLFGGRLFFVTRELPRDIAAIEKLDGLIGSQKHEIDRLCAAIELHEEEKEKSTKVFNRLSCINTYLEIETSMMKKRLTRLEASGDEEDMCKRDIGKDYDTCPEDRLRNSNLTSETEYHNAFYDNNGNCIFVSDEVSESRYWDVVSSRSKTPDDASFVFASATSSHHDEDVATRIASINTHAVDADVYEPQGDGDSVNKPRDAVRIQTDAYEPRNSLRNEHNNEEIKVDIHVNRKDYKKLLLAQELRDCIATIEYQNNTPNYDHYYHHSDNDVIPNNVRDETCYWDEVNSKTSYEDVSSVGSSNDTSPNHLYFILDKNNKCAKKVEQDEYNVLKKSLSLPRISTSIGSDEKLKTSGSAYDIKTMNKIAHALEENAIHIY